MTVTAAGAWGGWTYLSRPVADRYAAYSYEVSAAGQYAADHPGSVVIIDYYSGTDIQFLYWNDQPAIVSPGTRIERPQDYTTIVAMKLDDLTAAVGSELSARAMPVAWDPSGQPTVWAVAP